jgi:endonuclease/exonuclease/phosphatase family metal-dependent hydrolase
MLRRTARIPIFLSISVAFLLMMLAYTDASPADGMATPTCRQLKSAVRSQNTPDLSWIIPTADSDKAKLDRWCENVGPALFRAPTQMRAPMDGRILLVNWNIHVGNGDIEALIQELRAQEQLAGRGQPDFVFLLQESFRRSVDVPSSVRFHSSVPDRIGSPSQDIDALAGKLDWWMFYVPSMRNGERAGEVGEDRGNAILSSLPLEKLEVFELPFAVQRRVAVGAIVHDPRRVLRLRVATVHLDTRAPLSRGSLLGAAAVRNQQARAMGETIGQASQDGLSLVVGGDLNSFWGRLESSIGTLSGIAPHVYCGNKATHALGFTLDHVFARIAPGIDADSCRRLDSRFDSDHYPLVLPLNATAAMGH